SPARSWRTATAGRLSSLDARPAACMRAALLAREVAGTSEDERRRHQPRQSAALGRLDKKLGDTVRDAVEGETPPGVRGHGAARRRLRQAQLDLDRGGGGEPAVDTDHAVLTVRDRDHHRAALTVERDRAGALGAPRVGPYRLLLDEPRHLGVEIV